MKTELRMRLHSAFSGEGAIEIWHEGQFIGTITGADGPGVRILTKHELETRPIDDDGQVKVLDVVITPSSEKK